LNLNTNPINGPLPECMGQMKSLVRLIASDCGLEGSIPSDLNSQGSLIWLDLVSNQLTGEIPASIFQSGLLYLDLGYNKLSGVIPNTLTLSQNLFLFRGSYNHFTSMPENFGNLTSLETFYMDINAISSKFPQDLGLCIQLTSFSISGNAIRGTIPDLSSLTSLKTLEL